MYGSQPPKAKSSYPEVQDIGNDLKNLKTDVTHLANHVKEDGMQDISEKAKEGYKTAQAFGKKMEQRIIDKPAQSLAIAFASGLIASFFLSRR